MIEGMFVESSFRKGGSGRCGHCCPMHGTQPSFSLQHWCRPLSSFNPDLADFQSSPFVSDDQAFRHIEAMHGFVCTGSASFQGFLHGA